jgi:beta propeller repeat protein
MKIRLALLAIAALVPASTLAQPVFSGTERQITTDLADQFDPAISGNLVVYTDMRRYDADIWYYDLATGTEHPVTLAPADQQLSDVSGNTVVYTDLEKAHIFVFDVTAGTTVDLTDGRTPWSNDPAVGQQIVAWQDARDGNYEIYARNLATGEERNISNSPARDERASVSNGVIVWARCEAAMCDIFAYDWATRATRQITSTPEGDERAPDISGNSVAYEGLRAGDRDIYVFDLATGVEKRLPLPESQGNPNVSGDFVAFDDLSTGLYHVRLWHVPTGTVFDVDVKPTAQQYLNDIDGNRIVYTDDRNGQLDIYMYEFTVTFPSAGVTDCAHTEGFTPLLDVKLERKHGGPTNYDLTFAGTGPAVVCVDNGVDSNPYVTSGWLWLGSGLLVGPNGWKSTGCGDDDHEGWHHRHGGDHDGDRGRDHEDEGCPPKDLIEAHGTMAGTNHLKARLASAYGATIRVRVYQGVSSAAPAGGSAASTGTSQPAGGHDALAQTALSPSTLASNPAAQAQTQPAFGCSQGGPGPGSIMSPGGGRWEGTGRLTERGITGRRAENAAVE